VTDFEEAGRLLTAAEERLQAAASRVSRTIAETTAGSP
jgi:hypothetical protein